MGCTQSKIENEEAVSRCKDRKQFMKDAVHARNAFAAAHSAYTMALKNTGAALSDFGQGEVNDPHPTLHPHHPSLHHHHHHQPIPPTQAPYETLPPPPPLPSFSPAPPLKRASTMPAEFLKPDPKSETSNGGPIQEDVEEEEDDELHDANVDHDHLNHRRSRGGGGGGGGGGNGGRVTEPVTPQPPPSPPRTPESEPVPPPPPGPKDSSWDYFNFYSVVENMGVPSLSEIDEIRPSDNDESDGGVYMNNGYKRSEGPNAGINGIGGGGSGGMNGGGGVDEVEPKTPEKVIEPEAVVKPVKKPKQVAHSNSAPSEARRGVKAPLVGNVSLLQILNDLDDHFLKASESAHEVSKMLEATRLHYHSNFADNRGHIDHSARVMRVITWNRSFRGMPNADDGKDDFDAEEYETHATVLDKLLAWEKKLYDEVKAGELMKLEYHRKVTLLTKQKKRGANTESLEKTKAAVSHLHTRYIVDMQSMDSTVAEINHLRDDQLYPKLVALVDGMAKMWEAMHIHHVNQLKIVLDLRSIDVTQGPKETSEQHHERTAQLRGVVQVWHSQFQKLVNHQKEYIQALNSWLRLNLIPIESSLKEKVSSPPRVHQPPIQPLLHAWHEQLEKLPAELAGNAIFSFAGIISNIMLHQEEEVKLKEKCEETRKEFTRKSRAFEDWYHKHMQRKGPEDMDPDRTEDTSIKDPVAERKFLVESLQKRLEEEEEAHQKQCQQVRDKSLGSLKTHLPELFRAMSDFSFACTEMYKRLQFISQPRNQSERPS